jgi:hypothetical protein
MLLEGGEVHLLEFLEKLDVEGVLVLVNELLLETGYYTCIGILDKICL